LRAASPINPALAQDMHSYGVRLAEGCGIVKGLDNEARMSLHPLARRWGTPYNGTGILRFGFVRDRAVAAIVDARTIEEAAATLPPGTYSVRVLPFDWSTDTNQPVEDIEYWPGTREPIIVPLCIAFMGPPGSDAALIVYRNRRGGACLTSGVAYKPRDRA